VSVESVSASQKADFWAIVELFGHQRIAGHVTEASIGGCQFVRVDIPASGEKPAFTRLLGHGAIYAVNIVSEAVARAAASSLRVEPVSVYDLGPLLQQRIPPIDCSDSEFDLEVP
jgi:hypothetical protein